MTAGDGVTLRWVDVCELEEIRRHGEMCPMNEGLVPAVVGHLEFNYAYSCVEMYKEWKQRIEYHQFTDPEMEGEYERADQRCKDYHTEAVVARKNTGHRERQHRVRRFLTGLVSGKQDYFADLIWSRWHFGYSQTMSPWKRALRRKLLEARGTELDKSTQADTSTSQAGTSALI